MLMVLACIATIHEVGEFVSKAVFEITPYSLNSATVRHRIVISHKKLIVMLIINW